MMLRGDLHVHTVHSARAGTLRFLRSRDCYSKPLEVYRRAKERGMDLVAITDHDSIDGALELMRRLPDSDDVIVGEEVSCWHGSIEVHLGVYGMTESLHRDIQPLRANAFDVIACLRGQDVFFSLNHLLHFYRGQAPLQDYLRLLDEVPALEVRNGAMLPAHNLLIEHIASRWTSGNGRSRLGMIGGSDAHTLRRIGTTWTEAPGRNREEFLENLKRGRSQAGGAHGGAATVAGDTYGVIGSFMRSLLGAGPRDHAGWHRTACLAFAGLSLPFQFLPMMIAAMGKAREAAAVGTVTEQLHSLLVEEADPPLEAEQVPF
jgi:predicted metal-dependent phosphoesterase TrpH